jgi:hypothetical protein
MSAGSPGSRPAPPPEQLPSSMPSTCWSSMARTCGEPLSAQADLGQLLRSLCLGAVQRPSHAEMGQGHRL